LKAFHFTLERVLEWRAAQLLVEEARLRPLSELVAAIQLTITTLEQEEDKARHGTYVDGWELKALEAYCGQTAKQKQALRARLVEAQKQLIAQREKLLVARREHRLIEKLRERRVTEWVAESNKEVEQNASESYLARFNREK
jgi:flagellar export protein FliJ